MKRLGFTLIELLAVIAILAIILLIVVPIVNNTLNSSKQGAYKDQIELIRKAAERYVVSTKNLDFSSGYIDITLEDLYTGYYIESNIKDPRTGKNFDNNLCIRVKQETNPETGEINGILDFKIGMVCGVEDD